MKIQLYNNDCLIQLKELEENSIDSIVTDPPYEISFMSKGWDGTGIAFNQEVWKECLRVLKPGGHILSFGATRTYHRMTVAIEDAGFEIRDCLFWCYGSGFPKSHNIGNGFGTALKPAVEPVVMGRKPFKGNVAGNVLEWGTGGLNIDDCRIDTITEADKNNWTSTRNKQPDNTGWGFRGDSGGPELNTQGRWPANLILDEEAGKMLDEQSGYSKSTDTKGNKVNNGWQTSFVGGKNINPIERIGYSDIGGASRFFYCPKVSKTERNEGCDELEEKQVFGDGGGTYQGLSDSNKPSRNYHPTVKPVALLSYLIRLVTPKGGTVLDPFMGSGSTGKAAIREGMGFVGIEKEEEYFQIAQKRIEHEAGQHKYREFF